MLYYEGWRSTAKNLKFVRERLISMEINEYIVDKIIERRINKNNELEFKVIWKNYSESEFTWEPTLNLANNSIFKEYLRKNKLQV